MHIPSRLNVKEKMISANSLLNDFLLSIDFSEVNQKEYFNIAYMLFTSEKVFKFFR